MDKQNPNSSFSPNPYPWYDDRMTVLSEEEKAPDLDWPYSTLSRQETYDTPKKIYEYLDKHV